MGMVSSATLHKLSRDKEGRRSVGAFFRQVQPVAPSSVALLLSLIPLSPHLSPILRSSSCPCPLGLAACNLRAWAQRPNAKLIMGAGCVLI